MIILFISLKKIKRPIIYLKGLNLIFIFIYRVFCKLFIFDIYLFFIEYIQIILSINIYIYVNKIL